MFLPDPIVSYNTVYNYNFTLAITCNPVKGFRYGDRIINVSRLLSMHEKQYRQPVGISRKAPKLEESFPVQLTHRSWQRIEYKYLRLYLDKRPIAEKARSASCAKAVRSLYAGIFTRHP
jgi:hypothetical protein